jgi:flagellar biosynthesis/type III secretory pathway protein FliH
MLPLSKNHASEIAKRSADNSRKTIMRANWQELKEERKMCEALRELFADDLRESREEGIMEGRNVGKREGKLEGKREGEASKVIEIVIKKYKKGCSVKETADMLEEPQTLIKQIYDVIGQCAPDYNVEAIYKILLDKTI